MLQEDEQTLRQKSDYELAKLYTDYHEFLESPMFRPTSEAIREKYQEKLRKLMAELGRRHCEHTQTKETNQ